MKQTLFCFLFIYFGIQSLHADEEKKCMKPWVFFDLGNTIVDTVTNNYNPIFHMQAVSQKNEDGSYKWKDGELYPSAREYINKLQEEKTILGLLPDVPEEWGVNYPAAEPVLHYPTAKIIRLLDFLAGKVPSDNTSWKEGEPEFDYSPYGYFEGEGAEIKFYGRMFLPQNNTERKNKGSMVIFERAIAAAKEHNCKTIYLGEDTEEMKLAEKAGMYPYLVGVTSKTHFYIPKDKLDWYVENYTEGAWQGLGNNDF
jgi:hypothetical protein